MLQCPEGLKAFLRAYYHVKSADWSSNQPHPLGDRSASTMAVMPTYYIMRADENMAQTVALHHPSQDQVRACKWLPDDELDVYVDAYKRTGFQGGLNWYRCAWDPTIQFAQQAYAGAKLRMPTLFLAGEADWGMYQWPGDLEAMQATCLRFEGAYRIPAAGHWLQQEQPLAVMDYLERFWQRS
jgi:pimeloyl-ACP methyl ester carboxylesterase